MITSTSLFTTLGALAPRSGTPAAPQVDDFVALLQAELTKSGNLAHGVPGSIKPMPFEAPTPGSIKPMRFEAPAPGSIKPTSFGVPVDLEEPADEATKPKQHGVPTVLNPKPVSFGVPQQIKPSTEVDEPDVAAEEAADLDLGAPTEEITEKV